MRDQSTELRHADSFRPDEGTLVKIPVLANTHRIRARCASSTMRVKMITVVDKMTTELTNSRNIKSGKKLRQLQICIRLFSLLSSISSHFYICSSLSLSLSLFMSLSSSLLLSLLISISVLLCLCLFSSLSLFISVSVSFHFSFFLFSLSIPFHLSLPLLNDDDNNRPVGSLSVHTALSPECQGAWAVAHSLPGEHVRMMQETCVQVFLCKPRATWNDVGLYLCWKE